MSRFKTKGDQSRLQDLDAHNYVLNIEPVETLPEGRVYQIVFDMTTTDEQGRNDVLKSWETKDRNLVLEEKKWADLVNSEEKRRGAKYVLLS